jgi:hypothetical protein
LTLASAERFASTQSVRELTLPRLPTEDLNGVLELFAFSFEDWLSEEVDTLGFIALMLMVNVIESSA